MSPNTTPSAPSIKMLRVGWLAAAGVETAAAVLMRWNSRWWGFSLPQTPLPFQSLFSRSCVSYGCVNLPASDSVFGRPDRGRHILRLGTQDETHWDTPLS